MKNKTPLKLFVVEPRGSGGMMHYAYQLCTAFSEEGANVTLVTSQDYEMEAFPHNFSVAKKMKLWPLIDLRLNTTPKNKLDALWGKIFWTIRRLTRGLRLILAWVQLTNYLIANKPDIIQFGAVEFPFEAFFFNKLKRKELIITQITHEFEDREQETGFFHFLAYKLQTAIYSDFYALFFHAENNLLRFKALYPNTTKNSHIIPMGNEQLFPTPQDLDAATNALRQSYAITKGTPVILFFGTLTPSKGLSDLLVAFSIIYAQRKKARLIIAGMPTKYVRLQDYFEQANELKIKEGVIFDTRYIPIEEVAPLMTLASVVVYPYLNSTQSASLQVAYTFSRPVVATNVGGLPEAVIHRKSGILVPPAQPEALADAILELIEDPQLAETMGKQAKELSESKFAWAPIAQQILNVYKGLRDKETLT